MKVFVWDTRGSSLNFQGSFVGVWIILHPQKMQTPIVLEREDLGSWIEHFKSIRIEGAS